MPRVIGERPHPCGLIWGFDDDEVSVEFAHAEYVHDLDRVDGREWDVLVTDQELSSEPPENLFVVSFGKTLPVPSLTEDLIAVTSRFRSDDNRNYLERGYTCHSSELVVPDELSAPVLRLVETVLIPALREERRKFVITSRLDVLEYEDADPNPPRAVHPFVMTKDGFALAGAFQRPGGAWVWALPDVADRAACVRMALEDWTRYDNRRFPSKSWVRSPAWATPVELKIADGLRRLEDSYESFMSDFRRRKDETEGQMLAAQAAGDTEQRRLLTAQGDDLVEAVEHILSSFGFRVRNMDKIYSANDRREDLQLEHPAAPGWLALVEVRGYKGGAAVNDLMRLQRFAGRCEKETGRSATALWYVVNQFIGQDPQRRPPILSANPAELETFMEDGGLAIDTTDLFRLWRYVADGSVGQAVASRMLLGSLGRVEVSAAHPPSIPEVSEGAALPARTTSASDEDTEPTRG